MGSAVAANLDGIRERMAAACARAGRAEDEVRLVAVSKRIPLDKVIDACRAGQLDLGENRIPDALHRQTEVAAALAAAGLDDLRPRWHFIGHLQRNKAAKAAGAFDLLHAVHSAELADRLSARLPADARQAVLVEVNLSGEAQKQGVLPDDALDLAVAVTGREGLELRGFMTMARWGAPETELRATFAGLRRLAERARDVTGLSLPELSMGMSGDFEAAIAEGATLIRVGTAIFGSRE